MESSSSAALPARATSTTRADHFCTRFFIAEEMIGEVSLGDGALGDDTFGDAALGGGPVVRAGPAVVLVMGAGTTDLRVHGIACLHLASCLYRSTACLLKIERVE